MRSILAGLILYGNVFTFRDKFERPRLVTPVGTTINNSQRMQTSERVHSSGDRFSRIEGEIMKEHRRHRRFL